MTVEGLLALAEAHGRRFDAAARRGDLEAMDIELEYLRRVARDLREQVEPATQAVTGRTGR